MLDQSFTADNFEYIYDVENRKNSITEYLGTDYKDILAQIKELQIKIRQITKRKLRDRLEGEEHILTDLRRQRKELINKKKEIQANALERISRTVNNKDFKFVLEPKGDDIFVIQKEKEAFFAIKQLQYNIRKTFKVKQSSRHLILSQIKLLLNDNSPKYLIRTDVTKFFESIPQKRLLKKIDSNTLLSRQSKQYICQILDDYNFKKDTLRINKDKGVPRGVGISSYLSELYLKDVDSQIRNVDGVIYYARYVDDIFILISPNFPNNDVETYFGKIEKIVEKEGLELHRLGEKRNLIDLSSKINRNTRDCFTYLGYKIYIDRKLGKHETVQVKTTFGLSQNKKDRIERRVLQSIDYFNTKSKYDLKTARRDLLLCLRFLTTNTKLEGAKSRVKTGVFYSNDLLDRSFEEDINTLDKNMKYRWLERVSPYDRLFASQDCKKEYVKKLTESILEGYTFKKGFTDRTFHAFSKDELRIIKKVLR